MDWRMDLGSVHQEICQHWISLFGIEIAVGTLCPSGFGFSERMEHIGDQFEESRRLVLLLYEVSGEMGGEGVAGVRVDDDGGLFP